MSTARIESFRVWRTARIARLGPEDGAQVRELWYVLHGYGQLAPAFLEDFQVIDDGTRLIVAPEALSRFYNGDLESRLARRNLTVGASWMTSEERLAEISDTLDYLDALHARTTGILGSATPPVTLLGFSQGAATATRWAARGSVPFARLVVWGAALAPEVDIADPDSMLRRPETLVVHGSRDRIATPDAAARELDRLAAAAFPVRQLSFDGGHRLDRDTLRRIAGAPSTAGDDRP